MEAPIVPERMKFEARLRTRWVDEDNQKVLNNAIYLTLMEEARLAYFSKLGLMEENQFPFVLAQANVRFVAPGRGGSEVTVGVLTTRLGNSSFEQAYRVRDAESGAVWCEAVALLVAWDNARGAKCVMSADFKQALRRFEGLSD